MPVRSRLLAPACLTLALAAAACGGAASTPSASTAASAAASVAASASASPAASPAASSDASASPAASASAGAEVTVTAVDFKFEGVPAQVPTGTPMRLVNQGQEVHEMVVVRKLPTTTQSFEELLAMTGDEAQSLVDNVGVAFAEHGPTAADVVTAGEPGDYLMVCFIPAGTTSLPSMDPNASEAPSLGTGAPHFTLGMLQEFTVTR
jgi:plastocyanin